MAVTVIVGWLERRSRGSKRGIAAAAAAAAALVGGVGKVGIVPPYRPNHSVDPRSTCVCLLGSRTPLSCFPQRWLALYFHGDSLTIQTQTLLAVERSVGFLDTALLTHTISLKSPPQRERLAKTQKGGSGELRVVLAQLPRILVGEWTDAGEGGGWGREQANAWGEVADELSLGTIASVGVGLPHSFTSIPLQPCSVSCRKKMVLCRLIVEAFRFTVSRVCRLGCESVFLGECVRVRFQGSHCLHTCTFVSTLIGSSLVF